MLSIARRNLAHDKMKLATGPVGSGATSGTTVVITLLFAAAAWSPTIDGDVFEGTFRDGAAVASVQSPSPPPSAVAFTGLGSFSAGQIDLYQAEELTEDLWSYPNAVFFRYSSLSKRRNGRTDDATVRAADLQ